MNVGFGYNTYFGSSGGLFISHISARKPGEGVSIEGQNIQHDLRLEGNSIALTQGMRGVTLTKDGIRYEFTVDTVETEVFVSGVQGEKVHYFVNGKTLKPKDTAHPNYAAFRQSHPQALDIQAPNWDPTAT